MTAVLRGGVLDRIVFEIDEGASVIDMGQMEILYSGGPPPPRTIYRYSGSQDAEGNAIFQAPRQHRSEDRL